MLIKTERESIEVLMRTRGIISTGFGARMEARKLPKCVTGRGRGLREGPGKKVNKVFPRRSQNFQYQR